MLEKSNESAIHPPQPPLRATQLNNLPTMHPLLYLSILGTASAAFLPLQPRAAPDECEQWVKDHMSEDNESGLTSDGTAGIGAEFESSGFYWTHTGCSLDDTNAAKKKIIDGRKHDNWRLTADTGAGMGKLQSEYILEGKNIKVGSPGGDAAKAGAAAAQDLADWLPWDKPGRLTVDIEDSKCNPWQIGTSKNQKIDALPWSPQVTTPMPLEALYSLQKDQQKDLDSPERNILDGFNFQNGILVVVTKAYFQSNKNGMDKDKVSDDVLGFCSLVLSYAKTATKKLQRDQSPKLFQTFMPRTEFNTIYNMVKSKFKGDLFDLINNLACYTTKVDQMKGNSVAVDTNFCTGELSDPKPIGTKFGDLSYTLPDTNPLVTVNIKEWIQGIGKQDPSPDRLTKFDAQIDKSIGGYGTQTEKIWKSDRSAPLFEFRDLDPSLITSQFGKFMGDVDSAIQKLHTDFAKPPSKTKRDAPPGCFPIPKDDAPPTKTTPAPVPLDTVAPVIPPSQPSCVAPPSGSVKDSHEGELRKVVTFFCDQYAKDTVSGPVNDAHTVMAGLKTFPHGSIDIAMDYTGNSNEDDVYDIKVTSVDKCTPNAGYNLAEPVPNNKCYDILYTAWRSCNNQGRGGDITAGCLVYSIHTKY